jgi:hypothetical protein
MIFTTLSGDRRKIAITLTAASAGPNKKAPERVTGAI